MSDKVVITGLGVITRDAVGVPAYAAWLLSGGGAPTAPSIFDSSRFRARLGYLVEPGRGRAAISADEEQADVDEIDALDCAAYGLTAAREALRAGGVPVEHRCKIGLTLATTSGGAMDRWSAAHDAGAMPAAALTRNARPASAAAAIARSLGLGGPFANFSCACASSAVALSYAYERLRAGDADMMLAGGCDQVREADFAGFNALRAMDRQSCRPFDQTRRGMVMGDGAAMLLMEREDHARARGAAQLARFAATGLSSDAHHITAPRPDGLARAMTQALHQAGTHSDRIAYVNCHGTGTPANDEAEIHALSRVFSADGPRPVISSTKGATGHLLGTAAALEALTTVLALQLRQAPPMRSTHTPMETGFPMPGHDAPRALQGDWAMSNSLGFGGINVSLLFHTPPDWVRAGSPTGGAS